MSVVTLKRKSFRYCSFRYIKYSYRSNQNESIFPKVFHSFSCSTILFKHEHFQISFDINSYLYIFFPFVLHCIVWCFCSIFVVGLYIETHPVWLGVPDVQFISMQSVCVRALCMRVCMYILVLPYFPDVTNIRKHK